MLGEVQYLRGAAVVGRNRVNQLMHLAKFRFGCCVEVLALYSVRVGSYDSSVALGRLSSLLCCQASPLRGVFLLDLLKSPARYPYEGRKFGKVILS